MDNFEIKEVPQKGFTKLLLDYSNNNPKLSPFISKFPTKEGVLEHLDSLKFDDSKRLVLVEALIRQYKNTGIDVPENITNLLDVNTFCVTTGHQLGLYGSAKYFIHKTISTIKLARELNQFQKDKLIVPIFWLATEDHDFQEINSLNLYGKKISTTNRATGPLGRVSPKVFEDTIDEFAKLIGTSTNAKYLVSVFERAFQCKTWADATRYWVHALFGDELLILDGDDVGLKTIFAPYMEDELLNRKSHLEIELTSNSLVENGYHKQVGQREINLFYIEDNLRERIVFENELFSVLNTDISWSENEIINKLHNNPEKFSPNAALRPLYEEVVLPNVAYIGGPGELAYWFQLKSNFDRVGVPFPVLMLRDSFSLVTDKDLGFLTKVKLCFSDLSFSNDELVKLYLNRNTLSLADLSNEKKDLIQVQKNIIDKVLAVNPNLEVMLEAEFNRWNKLFSKLDKKLTKELKFREEVNITKLTKLQDKYFPNGKLNERSVGFMDDFIILGKDVYLITLLEVSNIWTSNLKLVVVS